MRLTSRKSQLEGAALIVALAFVVLMTISVVVFLSRSQTVRAIEASGAAKAQAEVFARAGIEYTIGRLNAEITDPNASVPLEAGEGTLFLPKTPAYMLPKMHLKAQTKGQQEIHVPSILKQSIKAFDPHASTVTTSEPNRQGRSVSFHLWAKSRLYFSPLVPALIPDWIYFDEEGPTEDPASPILGRIAFNIFITNNLLDYSVSGFPKSLLGNVREINRLKASTAGANIRKIGYIVPLIDDPDLVVVDFRNRESVTAGDYVGRVLNDRSGLLEPLPGDTQFISRIDMQRFYQRLREEYGAYTRDDPLAYMVPLVRAIDGPTWSPPTPTTANQFALTQLRTRDASIIDYFTDGTTRERSVKAGEPVAARRFPLKRLEWFDATHSIRDQAIRQYFGLINRGSKRWEYEDSHIRTLNEVAGLGREPNFFEMLKAAIESGSLGKSFPAGDGILTAGRDGDKDLHILKIGASIIDSVGRDNLPSTLVLNGSRVSGIKDLPYLHEVRFCQVIKTNSGGLIERIDQFILPILVNPHALPLAPATRPPVRARLLGWVGNPKAVVKVGETDVEVTLESRFSDIHEGIRAYQTDPDLYHTPHPINRTTVPSPDPIELPDYFSTAEDTHLGFWVASHDGADIPPLSPGTQLVTGTADIESFNVVLEYWNGSAWVIYDALLGDGSVGMLSEMLQFVGSASGSPDNNSFAVADMPYFLKPDPRTNRWGIARGRTSSKPVFLENISRNRIDEYPEETVAAYAAGALSRSGVFPSLPDPDGIVRENDLEIGSVVNPIVKEVKYVLGDFLNGERIRGGAAIPVSEERNAIRHEPFYTVAELGGVFRDQPWKTLDFATGKSGDKALLDYFRINEIGPDNIVAGRINLNILNPPDTLDPQIIDTSYLIGGTEAVKEEEVSALRNYFVNTITGSPLKSVAEMVGIPDAANLATSYPALTGSKQRREMIARALGTAGQVRTWNFYVDLIAQVGTMASATNPTLRNDFIPRAEHRFWLHVAMDRFTGKIVDVHIESYQE